MLVLTAAAGAQTRNKTTYYPNEIYPGETIVTVTNAAGIERIRFRSSANVRVTVPTTTGCSTSVDVKVVVDDPVLIENVGFTVYDCTGEFSSETLTSDHWQILHHKIGPLAISRDTCTDASVSVDGTQRKVVDSMISDDPSVRIVMPSKVSGEWAAEGSSPLPYRICFSPTIADTHTTQLRLYIKRRFPHKGLTNYMIAKPVTVAGFVPPPPPEPEEPEDPGMPPLVDPTTFRNIIMPTAETMSKGKFFAGNYDIAGWIGGYGLTDNLMLLGGGAFIPEFVQKVAVGTLGAKYRALKIGLFEASVGAFGVYSSAETNISVFAPFGVLSFGSRAHRISIAGGYTWKNHSTDSTSFDENATVFAIGGDVTVKRGWKLLAETYFIEKSGLRPIAITSRWFGERLAFDLGFILDLEGTKGLQGNGALSGKIERIRAAPLLSLLMIF
ncbi:MAG: hypothetical protein H7X80_01620 [bacterium]|nr:hypothetical protein [Candidatus Kapabacteria bacterium]